MELVEIELEGIGLIPVSIEFFGILLAKRLSFEAFS
jgi:hypothetical protein